MIQTVVAYCIVAVAVAWLAWTLFLPASLRNRLRGGGRKEPTASDCSDGCATCAGCPTTEPPLKHHSKDNTDREPVTAAATRPGRR